MGVVVKGDCGVGREGGKRDGGGGGSWKATAGFRDVMTRAFILGAGLGTRLRPLTHVLPKPLIPVHHRPLMAYALGHLGSAGVEEFVVNTHHLPEAYGTAFPGMEWEGKRIVFRHEPVVLETGGGLANVRDLLEGDEPFVVYNGDVLTDVPLERALREHRERGNLVTLVLRSRGAVCNVALDRGNGRVVDLRNALGTGHPDLYQFTGLYVVDPAFFGWLPERGVVESVVAAWLRAISGGERIGGVVIDEGMWFDLGDRASYLEAHAATRRVAFPAWGPMGAEEMAVVHPGAEVGAGVVIDAGSSVRPGCRVGAGAILEGTVLWPGADVAVGARLRGCIVLPGAVASGELEGVDIAGAGIGG